MATFHELVQSMLALTQQLERDYQDARYDDALTTLDDIKADVEKIEKIVEQGFAGES